jgi:hypothetical protein
MNITVDQIMEWNPCGEWLRKHIEEIFKGSKSVSLVDFLQCTDISSPDRIWVGCHALPETRWIWVDRARFHAAEAMEVLGLSKHAEALRSLPQAVDEKTACAVRSAARAADNDAVSDVVVDADFTYTGTAYAAYAAVRAADFAIDDAAGVAAIYVADAAAACSEDVYDEEIQRQLDILITKAKEREGSNE